MYDAIVIGSGIGGMTAARLLAGVAGKKVLVLEKHTEPGGSRTSSGETAQRVATGTGLAPFLPLFERLEQQVAGGRAELIFGCRTNAEDITQRLGSMPATVTRCISREAPLPGSVRGRVTAAVSAMAFDPDDTDFYVCGSAARVADVQTLHTARGAPAIHVEAY